MFFLTLCLGIPFQAFASPNNIALNKSSESSHLYLNVVPENGNDGDTNSDYEAGSCVVVQATAKDPFPWWQVNLEAESYVYSVAITNRQHSSHWRLQNFTITVYPGNPTTPGAVGDVCVVYPGIVGSGVTEVLMCAPGVRGQYVRIQKNFLLNNDALQFCEAQVYGKPVSDRVRAVFSRLPGQRLPGTPLSQKSGTVAECARICFNIPLCDGFNFDGGFGGGTGTCQFMFQQESLVNDVDCEFFQSS